MAPQRPRSAWGFDHLRVCWEEVYSSWRCLGWKFACGTCPTRASSNTGKPTQANFHPYLGSPRRAVALERAACLSADSVTSAPHLDGAQTVEGQGRRWCADAYFPRVFLDFLLVLFLVITSVLHDNLIAAVAFKSLKKDRLVPHTLVPHPHGRFSTRSRHLKYYASFWAQKRF